MPLGRGQCQENRELPFLFTALLCLLKCILGFPQSPWGTGNRIFSAQRQGNAGQRYQTVLRGELGQVASLPGGAVAQSVRGGPWEPERAETAPWTPSS